MADGMGCQCAAYSSADCGCEDVDWTPQIVYDLQDEIVELEKQIACTWLVCALFCLLSYLAGLATVLWH